MGRSKVAIVIPAFNEEKTISKIVKAANKFGQSIVVDDGSKDKTSYEAEKSGAIVERHETNLGYDNALNTGFKSAEKIKCEFIITLDADGQHEPKLLQKFIEALDSGNSIVLGVRNKKARLAEYFFGFYTSLRYGILDPLCGLKAYRTENYKLIGSFDTYNSIGTELMLKNISLGKSFKQIYFKVKKRNDKTRFGNSILVNLKIFRSLFFCIFKNVKI